MDFFQSKSPSVQFEADYEDMVDREAMVGMEGIFFRQNGQFLAKEMKSVNELGTREGIYFFVKILTSFRFR